MGAFAYLQDNGASCFHPGIGLNAGVTAHSDYGAPVVAISAMELAATIDESTGFGLHQWWRLRGGDFDGHYVHLCHVEQVYHRAEGSIVRRGDVIATCGRSGGWEFCHLHLEVRKQAPPTWSYWPKGERKALVAGAYVDPLEVCARYDRLAERAVVPTPDYGPVVDVIALTGYPVGEACRLIRTANLLGANADSISGWVNQIGALEAEVARLTAMVGGAVTAEVSGDASGA